jgi:hypothetical protein
MNNLDLLTDAELNEFLTEAGLPSDAYQKRQRAKHDQAVKSGDSAAARNSIWRAATRSQPRNISRPRGVAVLPPKKIMENDLTEQSKRFDGLENATKYIRQHPDFQALISAPALQPPSELDFVVTDRFFRNAYLDLIDSGEAANVWQIYEFIVCVAPQNPVISFAASCLCKKREVRPLALKESTDSFAVWEPSASLTEQNRDWWKLEREASNKVLSLMGAESPVSVNVSPRLLSQALSSMPGDSCVLSLIPTFDETSGPWRGVRVQSGQSIAMVAPLERGKTGTWCDRYPRPNAVKFEIDPPDDWFCIADEDYPEDGDDCTVAFMDAHGEIRVFRGNWREVSKDWVTTGGTLLFGLLSLPLLPFPVYWTPKRLTISEAIKALTGQSEPDPS